MSIWSKVRSALTLKQAPGVKFPGSAIVFWGWDDVPADTVAADIGDGTSADVLMTPIRWLQRAIVEAPLETRDREGNPLPDNELIPLLETPTPFYAWEVLVAGTVLSLSTDGNAYWVAALNDAGQPVELWYAPHFAMAPAWPQDDPTKFITHYDYAVAGETQHILPFGGDPDDVPAGVDITEGLAVVHFREGVDPKNLRKGLSPLKGLLREVWTDNEAARFTAVLLKNNGIPGVIVSPADKDATIDPDQAEAAKAKIEHGLTGENRGKPLVMLGPTKVEQFGFSPQELDLSPLRDVAEERVTAALGVPAAVVGFGAGLQTTRVGATMLVLKQLAWENGVIPMQRIIAGEMTRTLAPTFNAAAVAFNNIPVSALRENEAVKADRVLRLYTGGVTTRAEARTSMGLESDRTDEVYVVTLTQTLVPQGTAITEPTSAAGNGAGNDEARAAIIDIVTKQHRHSAAEELILANAQDAAATPQTSKMATSLDRIKRDASPKFVPPLLDVFGDLGASAEAATEIVLEEMDPMLDATPAERADADGETKQEAAAVDAIITAQIMELTDVDAAQKALAVTLEEGYLLVANEVTGAVNEALGVDFVLTDAAQQQVLKEGGLRAGLIDLTEQTRDAIFEGLAEARAEGMTADNLARFIRARVEAGPWRDAATRAKVIARTEGANAANFSTIEVAKAMPETEFMQVFDNRSGFDDEICSRADGSVITIEAAEAIGLAHPNCTRSFVPINSLLMEELGLSGPMSRINQEGAP